MQKPVSEAPGALHDILIVELGERTGASVCCSLLAQLGATIIVIEPPEARADAANLSVKWNWRDQMLAGKLSLFAGKNQAALVRKVLDRADVVVTSSDLLHPDMAGWRRLDTQIVCDVTAWGQNGPMAGQPHCDAQIQAMTGLTSTTGLPEAPPLSVPLPILEYMCGVHSAGAVLAAHRLVARGGPGQLIDMALYDCGFNAMSSFFSRLLIQAEDGDKLRRMGNRHTLSAPWNVYRAKDGWILICTGSNEQWRRLCERMGRPELAADPRYASSTARVERVDEVDSAVQHWVGQNTLNECVAAFAQASIPGGPITPIDRYPREPNLEHRRMIWRFDDASGDDGGYTPGSPLKMSRTPGRALTRVPAPGADAEAIMALIANRPSARTATAGATPTLSGLRVLEIGHYTTAPIAARHLAALGADVIKIEPPEGEAARGWAPFDRGQSVFFTVSNSDKRNLTLDLDQEKDRLVLRHLIETSDVLLENLKPGALAKRGFSVSAIRGINARMVYCSVSGFGADSIYAGRPAFDTVVQGMSGLMDLVRSKGIPLKTGMSSADVMGAAMSVVAILGALAYRDRSGEGQYIDLSMQDIVAWSTQAAWNDGLASYTAEVVTHDDVDAVRVGARIAPIMTPPQVMGCTQTAARRLHFKVEEGGDQWPALAVPLRLTLTPPDIRRPGAPLARDNESILHALVHATPIPI